MNEPEMNGVERTGPLVTVLIITYNSLRHLHACLSSVLDQDFPREQYEVVVVDNASQDGSADIAERDFPGVRVVRLDRNYGPIIAGQLAGPYLKGRYLAYLNHDVVAHRRWLSELVTVTQSNPQAGIVESNMILPSWPEYDPAARDAPIRRAYVCDLTPFGVQDFSIVSVGESSPPIPVAVACCAGCIFDPQIMARLGYWMDPGFFAYSEDYDLGLRLNASGYQVLLAPRSLVYHNSVWLFGWSRRNIWRAYLTTRNTFLCFFKLSYFSEFVQLLPRILWGRLVRAGQHKRNRFGRVVYALAAAPMLAIGLLAAVFKMPGYGERRRLTLSRRIKPEGWLVETLRNAQGGSGQSVWHRPRASGVETPVRG